MNIKVVKLNLIYVTSLDNFYNYRLSFEKKLTIKILLYEIYWNV